MARAQRLERIDIRRAELEIEYEHALIAALRTAAAGSWGLFGHVRGAPPKSWAPIITDLCDRGRDIDAMRDALGLAPFALHEEFEASRGPVSPNAPGEPKQAQAWLDRLAKSE